MTTEKKERLKEIKEEIERTNKNYRLHFEWHRSSLGVIGISLGVLMNEALQILNEGDELCAD